MVLNGNDFLAALLETFREEAQDHMSAIAAGLLILEKREISPDERKTTIEEVFREIHSLKGASRAVGLRDIESLCQHQETVFSAIKKGTLSLSQESFDLFHSVLHALERLLEGEEEVKVSDLNHQLRILASSGSTKTASDPFGSTSASHVVTRPSPERRPDEYKGQTQPEPSISGTKSDSESLFQPEKREDDLTTSPPMKDITMVKISSSRLENLFARADDLMGARLSAGQRSSGLRDLIQNFLNWKWTWSQTTTDIEHLRMESERTSGGSPSPSLPVEIERVTNFLEYNRVFIQTLEREITAITRAAFRDQYLLDTATSELIDEIKQVILIPASSILEYYPRAARELARDDGKDVDVQISGGEIEIDRRILEGVRDPILHIIRNSIDHGIESRDIRLAKGKAERGQIQIRVTHVRGHQAEIHITDDGAGIDTGAVRSAAIVKDLISPEDAGRMDSNHINRLIFKSGLSTKKDVSTISGRGLGLAIALEKVEKIGGAIRIETSPSGTTFILTLPLTLATYRGIQVYTNRQPFFLPLRSVDRVMQVKREDIKTIENRTVIGIGDESVAIVSLAQVLGMNYEPGHGSGLQQVILVLASGIKFGLLVDQIVGSQEIVVKDLGPQLLRVRHINGATILGDGMVVPVINCEDLAATISGMEHVPTPGQMHSIENVPRKILVVEDSITSRMLLKNILTGAGYLVETAVDGVDAMTKLKTDPVDLVVSDIDMPRMNGFILTEKIRSDPSLTDIPVILVTSLDTREDREHGITVGASAYIVKSNFDQSNLLEVISRHIQ